MIFILIILLVEIFYKPRLDYTDNDQLLLWYGGIGSKRKFIIVFNNN